MNRRAGRRRLVPRDRPRAGDFPALLRAARSVYRGWHVARLRDEDPSHTAGGPVGAAGRPGIELRWRPERRPKLNPMGTRRGRGRDVIGADHPYGTPEERVNRLLGHLGSLTPREARHTAGVQAKGCWPRSVS